jgi:hypothetical protein
MGLAKFAQTGLEFAILLLPPLEQMGLHVCTARPGVGLIPLTEVNISGRCQGNTELSHLEEALGGL